VPFCSGVFPVVPVPAPGLEYGGAVEEPGVVLSGDELCGVVVSFVRPLRRELVEDPVPGAIVPSEFGYPLAPPVLPGVVVPPG